MSKFKVDVNNDDGDFIREITVLAEDEAQAVELACDGMKSYEFPGDAVKVGDDDA